MLFWIMKPTLGLAVYIYGRKETSKWKLAIRKVGDYRIQLSNQATYVCVHCNVTIMKIQTQTLLSFPLTHAYLCISQWLFALGPHPARLHNICPVILFVLFA